MICEMKGRTKNENDKQGVTERRESDIKCKKKEI